MPGAYVFVTHFLFNCFLFKLLSFQILVQQNIEDNQDKLDETDIFDSIYPEPEVVVETGNTSFSQHIP